MSSYIRFDWAMKNILQYSNNYEIASNWTYR